jgi:hypothetical protein
MIGFLLFGIYWSFSNNTDLAYFTKTVFLDTAFYQDKIITVSVLFDVLLFFVFMQMHYYNLCKGILGVVIVTVPVVVVLSM